ncbi:hypothetical protein BTO05_10980 [Winogradskyella sp. PC-19]|uniref:McrB family protein n=1 Tax=Winogradskyella sp. PC-19 TaxID=754417 RepID=UPI000B3CC90A|nr:AAA family ATPase [Winogradskyella sp. PC-19]ARV10134.1 hypothetical protein BTO05_10980 [Winogradskyella sp. PC-19]
MSNITIDNLKQQATLLNLLSNDEEALFNYLNTNQDNLDEVIQQYKPENEFRPVNTLRFLIANELKKGNKINAEVINQLKQALENRDVSGYYSLSEIVKQSLINYKQSKVGMFPNWKQVYKILFPFIHNQSDNEQVKASLNQLADEIITSNQFQNVTKHIVSFQGPQNYGADHAWVAIIPESSPSVQYAYQMFFVVDVNGLGGGIHKGHNLTKQQFENQDLKFNSWEDYLEHTKNTKEQWIQLNSDINFLFINDEKAFVKTLKKVEASSVLDYFKILDRLKEDLDIQDEEKLVFSIAKNRLSFQVGKRYCLNVNKQLFDFISYNDSDGHQNENKEVFSGTETAYLYKSRSADIVFNNYEEIKGAVAIEIDRDNHALAKTYDNSAFRKAVFDKDYRLKFIKGDFYSDKIILDGQRIFKISMGKDYFNDEAIEKAINEKLVLVHSETKPKGRSKISQADIFINQIRDGDFFYLTHSNKNVKLIGSITSPSKPATFNNMHNYGWLERSFEPLITPIKESAFNGKGKYWTPNTVTTCWEISEDEIEEANRVLFKPFFNIEFINNDMENKFKEFLNLSLSEGTVKTYLSAIRSLEKLAKSEGLRTFKIYEITNVSAFQDFWTTLKKIQSYIITNDKHHNRYSSALLKYEEFLYSLKNTVITNRKYIAPLNQIFYGPPGTGKTYNTILESAKIITQNPDISYTKALEVFNENLRDKIEFITFHQNYSYEDFIQGLRPDVEQKALSFNRADGVFTKMVTNALFEYYKEYQKKQKQVHNTVDAKIDLNDAFIEFMNTLEIGQQFNTKTGGIVKVYNFTDRQNIEFRPINGVKSYLVSANRLLKLYKVYDDIDNIKRVNEDIREAIGGCNSTMYYVALREFIDFLKKYKESVDEFVDEEEEYDYDDITYRRKKELLSNFSLEELRSVSKHEVSKYVIIIDEINRANISRVFGELITLIEKDKRSHGKIPLKSILPSGESFIVPSNLYIIGTMNTADKSIALLDIALRRRFEFVPMYPDSKSTEDKVVKDSNILDAINEEIINRKGHDFTIGHSYFMGEDYDLKNTIDNKVIPLLLEYFMNDFEEVKKIMSAANITVDGWPMQYIPNDN